MRTRKERRIDQWRVCGAFLLAFVAFIAMLTGCSTVRDPYYNGGEPSSQITTLVRVKIENLRTQDAADPRISLVGTGTHSLGILKGINGKIDQWVDTRWLGADGCVLIVAHYVGLGNLVFSKVCWRPGEMIEATLLDHWDPNTAWSHRE